MVRQMSHDCYTTSRHLPLHDRLQLCLPKRKPAHPVTGELPAIFCFRQGRAPRLNRLVVTYLHLL